MSRRCGRRPQRLRPDNCWRFHPSYRSRPVSIRRLLSPPSRKGDVNLTSIVEETMTLYRALSASLLYCVFLSGCNQASPNPDDISRRESFKVGASEFSIPVGSDGFVQITPKGANWGFDTRMWARTVGIVGVLGSARPTPFPDVGNSSISNDRDDNIVNKVGLNRINYEGGEAYQSSDPSYKYSPVYFFQQDLPGYVQCPTSATQGKEPDMDKCRIHIIKDGVHHSFPLTARQVPLAGEVARIFLAVITAK